MKRQDVVLAVDKIKRSPGNARTHSKKQIRQIADSIKFSGFGSPLLVDENLVLIAGDGRLSAAKLLGMPAVPAVILIGRTSTQKRSLALAENRIALSSGWDRDKLSIELPELEAELLAEGQDITLTGFSHAEIDEIRVDFNSSESDPTDEIANGWLQPAPVTVLGDVWKLKKHRLLCGDARSEKDHRKLMNGELAAMACHDVPYNVKIAKVVGRGRVKHSEFPMASGEMNIEGYSGFLKNTLSNSRAFSKEGSLTFVFNDWRHIDQVKTVGTETLGEMINLVCWVKTSPGMGSFYRSQHELIAVFRVGDKAHLNNIDLGRSGRNRSNVWRYPGANQSKEGRESLATHPTPKPVAMIADAIKDCTGHNDVVLDCFCGSGTTIMAAEKVGRRAFAMEIEPRFVDLSIRRWQTHTGEDAIHEESGLTFDELAQQRAKSLDPKTGTDEAAELSSVTSTEVMS